MNARSLFIIVLLLAAPTLFAQARGARMGGHTGLGFRAPVRSGLVGGFHHRGFHRNRFFTPFWSSAFWWDDGFYPDEQPVAVQQPPAPAAQLAPPTFVEVKPANPLLIELQGGRFVRLSGNEANPVVAGPAASSAASPSAELPPAVLVFHDGRRQEVSSYAIIGPALYASGSYWTNGYWSRKILLADLDLPATVRANQERGVAFVLPSSPDQVVTRP
jgi:hypothetical protein